MTASSETSDTSPFSIAPKMRLIDKRYKFCPHCHNLLQVKYKCDKAGEDLWRRKCNTCPYVFNIKGKHRYTVHAFNDDDDQIDIVETSKANEHRQTTEIMCPKCNHNEAYFYQMQTRSADEPMTTFYECTSKTCRNNWRD